MTLQTVSAIILLLYHCLITKQHYYGILSHEEIKENFLSEMVNRCRLKTNKLTGPMAFIQICFVQFCIITLSFRKLIFKASNDVATSVI